MRRIFLSLLMILATPVSAQEREVPYWASLSVDEANLRVGPNNDYRIEWVYHRKGLPLKVLRVKEGWRLVEDPDGSRGWMVGRFLSLARTAFVRGAGLAPMHAAPNAASRLLWRLEPGVSGALGDCDMGWCEFEIAGRTGYVPQTRLWGAGAP